MSDEIIVALITAVTTLGGGVVAYILRRLNQYDAEKRLELETTRQQRDQLITRVTDLEEKAKKVPELEKQLAVVCKQLEELQEWKDKAEIKLQERDATIERQSVEIDRLKDQNRELFDANKTLQIEVRTYQKALTWLGIERAEAEKIKTDDLTAAAAKVTAKAGETPGDSPQPTANKNEDAAPDAA